MLQTNLKVVAVGEPDLEALTDGEKRTFFESIFSRIVELHQQTQIENKNERSFIISLTILIANNCFVAFLP